MEPDERTPNEILDQVLATLVAHGMVRLYDDRDQLREALSNLVQAVCSLELPKDPPGSLGRYAVLDRAVERAVQALKRKGRGVRDRRCSRRSGSWCRVVGARMRVVQRVR